MEIRPGDGGRVRNRRALFPPARQVRCACERAIAQSTFHHFADYNWDIRAGSPSFVTEPPSDGLVKHPQAAADTRRYVLGVADWLGDRTHVVA